jgi:twitching motility two-component system response regulator PilG
MKILLVDDSSAIETLGRMFIEGAGYEFDFAPNGYVAMEKIKDNKYCCFIIDIEMPEMDGLNLCRLLSASKEFFKIPKIILSSNSGEFDRAKGRLCGADRYVTKPFDKLSLLNALEVIT